MTPAAGMNIEAMAVGECEEEVLVLKLRLARSGREMVVRQGQSILDAVLDSGIDAPFSCRSGFCATCETTVLSGTPEHRDTMLSDEDRRSNRSMMICCSCSKTAELELDL